MQPYLVLFASSAILALFVSSRVEEVRRTPARALVYWYFTVALILFAGLRYNTGFDYGSYLGNWWGPAQDFGYLAIHQKEPLLVLIFNLAGSLGLSYQGGLLVVSTISIGAKAYVLQRYSPYPFLSLLLLIGDFYLLQEMGQIRSGLAMALLALAFHFHIQNKKHKSIFLYGLACLTHVASVPFAVIYIVSRMRINPSALNLSALIVGVFVVFYLLVGPIVRFLATLPIGQAVGVSSYTVRVLEGVEPRSILTAGTLFSVGVLVLASTLRTRVVKEMPYFNELLWLYGLGVCFIVSGIFLGHPGARIARIFLFYQALLIPILITVLRPRLYAFIAVFGVIAMYAFSKFVLVLISRSDSFIPYQMAEFF